MTDQAISFASLHSNAANFQSTEKQLCKYEKQEWGCDQTASEVDKQFIYGKCKQGTLAPTPQRKKRRDNAIDITLLSEKFRSNSAHCAKWKTSF